VCNSDGYVGHMCLLSLQSEPIVTLNTPLPGCNSRITCICAAPPAVPLEPDTPTARLRYVRQTDRQTDKQTDALWLYTVMDAVSVMTAVILLTYLS